MNTDQELSTALFTALLALDRAAAERLLKEGAEDIGHTAFIERIIVPALERLGRDWESGTVALAEVYMSSRLCEDLLEEFLTANHIPRTVQPRLALAVLQDYHLLGKRMVLSVLQSAGFAVTDYGTVDVDALVERVRKDRIEVLLVSVLMLASALQVGELTRKLRETGCETRVIVGGAPFRFDETLWKEVGADAVGQFASDAPALIEGFLKQGQLRGATV